MRNAIVNDDDKSVRRIAGLGCWCSARAEAAYESCEIHVIVNVAVDLHFVCVLPACFAFASPLLPDQMESYIPTRSWIFHHSLDLRSQLR